MTSQDGRQYCAQAYGAELMVPNSKEESLFIGGFLTTLKVQYFGIFVICLTVLN